MELTAARAGAAARAAGAPGPRGGQGALFELVFPGEAEVQYEAIEVVVYRLRKKLAGTG
jgi:two-component system response regulator TctD